MILSIFILFGICSTYTFSKVYDKVDVETLGLSVISVKIMTKVNAKPRVQVSLLSEILTKLHSDEYPEKHLLEPSKGKSDNSKIPRSLEFYNNNINNNNSNNNNINREELIEPELI